MPAGMWSVRSSKNTGEDGPDGAAKFGGGITVGIMM